jgi:hypothetical protein
MSSSTSSSPLSSAQSISDVELPDVPDHISSSLSVVEAESEVESPEMSPESEKREDSPPHEEVLADNPDIAVSKNASFACTFTRFFSRQSTNCHV